MKKIKSFLILTAACCLAGCGGTSPTTFIHPDYNFGFVERVAVVPFENLTNDQGAGARATRYFISGLLATESFDVVEPGEVTAALAKHSLIRTAELTQDQAIAIGKDLAVQALFLGSIGESASVRSGSSNTNVVTLDVRMVETDTGVTVWSATNTETSGGFWSSLFGTGQKSKSEVTRICVERSIGTLVK